jgi:hypothetical protein
MALMYLRSAVSFQSLLVLSFFFFGSLFRVGWSLVLDVGTLALELFRFSWSLWLLMLLRLKLVLHQTCNFFSGSSLVCCFSGLWADKSLSHGLVVMVRFSFLHLENLDFWCWGFIFHFFPFESIWPCCQVHTLQNHLKTLLCDVWDWEDVLIFVLPAHLVFFEEASGVRGSYYSCLKQLNFMLLNEKILEQVSFLSGCPDT